MAEVRCPIDVRGLRAFADAGEGRDDVHAGSGLTLGQLAGELAEGAGGLHRKVTTLVTPGVTLVC